MLLNIEKITTAVQEELTGLIISRARCSLARSHLSRCRLCQEVCPAGALTLTEEGPRVENCRECGLCAGQCPTGALTWKRPDLEALLAGVKKLANSEGLVYLYCASQAGLAKGAKSVQVPCLGSIPWEGWLELLLLGERVKILLPLKSCQNCRVSTGGRIWQEQLTKAQEIMGRKIAIVSQIPVLPKAQEEKKNQRQRGRREFFALIFNLAKNTPAKVLLDQEVKNNPTPSPRRRVLMNFLRKNPEYAAKIRLKLPVFNERCQFCGACSLLCPQGALTLEEGVNGKGLELDRHLCSGCGLCVEICYHRGAEMKALPADEVIIPQKTTFCEK